MANRVRIRLEIKGDKETHRLCKELPKRAVKKATRAATTAATTPIVKDLRNRIQIDTGLAKKSVAKKIKSYGGNSIGIVGANKAVVGQDRDGRKRVPAKYWHLILRGVKPHAIKTATGSYTHPGFAGSNALLDSFEANKGKAADIMEKKMKEVVLKEAAKLGN